jgi:hypothetical protein
VIDRDQRRQYTREHEETTMPDYNLLTEDLVHAQIDERARQAARVRLPGPRRPRGRHALAQRLHRVADRLDT